MQPARHHESILIRRLIVSVVILILLATAFLLWGVQLLVNVTEVAGSVMRKETPVPKRGEPIFPPRLEPLYSATNSAQITITGAGRSGLELSLFHNDQNEAIRKTVIGNDGLFSFTGINLKDGLNTFTAKQAQSGGQTSPSSESLSVTLDKQPPKIEVTEPAENIEITGTDRKEVNIAGKTEDGVTITVNDRWIAVNSEGAFATKLTLREGENSILILATDLAGNTTKITRTVRYST